jgi:hypothetical protein
MRNNLSEQVLRSVVLESECRSEYAPFVPPNMNTFRLRNHVRNVCALVAATMILPVLAHAGQNNQGQNNNNQGRPPALPEVNAGWVLVPVVGVVLLV